MEAVPAVTAVKTSSALFASISVWVAVPVVVTSVVVSPSVIASGLAAVMMASSLAPNKTTVTL